MDIYGKNPLELNSLFISIPASHSLCILNSIYQLLNKALYKLILLSLCGEILKYTEHKMPDCCWCPLLIQLDL